MRRIITLLAFISLLTACSDDDPKEPEIVLEKEELFLKIGEQAEIGMRIVNDDPNYLASISVVSENEKIARVSYSLERITVYASSQGETYLNVEFGEISKRIKITVSNTYTLEEYYNRLCYGYKVKDTTNLKIISAPSKKDGVAKLYGIRSDKLWIGEFDSNSQEQIKEYISNKPVPLKRTVHTGYGEYEDVTVNGINGINSYNVFYETENGWVADLGCTIEEYPHTYSLLIFNTAGDTKDYFFKDGSSYNENRNLRVWYNGSFIRLFDLNGISSDSNYSVFKENGDIILSGSGSLENNSNFPIDYDKYIILSHKHIPDTDEKNVTLEMNVEMRSLTNPDFKFSKTFEYNRNNTETESKLSYEIISLANQQCTFKVCIAYYYSGTKIYQTYEVDGGTGSIKEITD